MTTADVLALIDGLRSRGVMSFEGLGVIVEMGPLMPAGWDTTLPKPPGQPHVSDLVDAGGGVMVDPDVFGHEP